MSFNKIQKNNEKKLKKHMKKDGWFVGTRIVDGVSVNEEVHLVGVHFDDDTEANYTIKQWESVRSKQPYGNNEISQRQFHDAIGDIVEQCLITFRANGEAENEQQKVEATNLAIKHIADILMENRADINSMQFVFQNVDSVIKNIIGEVEKRVNTAFRDTAAKMFGADAVEQIEVAQIHNKSLELSEDSGDNEGEAGKTSA